MKGYIDNINFAELEIQKYWAPPSTWTDEKQKQETSKRIFSGTWLGSQKRDGALYVFLKDEDGDISLRGRSKSVNGGYLDKWEWLPQLNNWANTIPSGTCLIGEVFRPGEEGSKITTTIMGCLKDKAIARQINEKDKMHYYAFDIMAYNGKSLLKTQAFNRFNILEALNHINSCDYVEYAKYYNGKELWAMLQELLADGYEGMVITEGSSIYEPGKRPSKTTMKIKKNLKDSIDCFFTGRTLAPTRLYTGKEIDSWQYWEDEKTGEKLEGNLYKEYYLGKPIVPITKLYFNSWAGSLEIGVLDGEKIVSLGLLSGLTDEIKANPQKYANKPIEVTAMELNFDKEVPTLRHGKLVRFRDDITLKDCTLDKLVSNRNS